jgi:osmotically-inducible protein OsmY
MKFLRCNISAPTVIAICLGLSGAISVIDANAQSTASGAHLTRSDIRKANWKLEREVRKAINHANVDSADVLIRANGGKVSLSGTAADPQMIQAAGTAASEVPGVISVNNLLSVQEKGH